jgi:hypothetical protein
MERLLEIGFRPAGEFVRAEQGLILRIDSEHTSRDIIYSFIVDGTPKYFGISRNSFERRMYQYLRPGVDQRTNVRINEQITNALNNGSIVEIFLFVDQGLIRFGHFPINLALGLEYTLIQHYSPEWNVMGNSRPNFVPESDTVIQNLEDQTIPQEPVISEFTIPIVETYFKSGFINIPKDRSDLFGPEGSSISIYINDNVYEGKIYRNANNGSPRIYLGRTLSDWIRVNFRVSDLLRIRFDNNILILSNN